MLDRVLLQLKEEVAMDGYQGCSLENAWGYVKQFLSTSVDQNASPPAVDQHYKRFLWPFLLQLDGISFFPESQLAMLDQQLKASIESDSKEPVVYDYNTLEDIHTMTFDEMNEKYGSSIRLVASKELQDAQLYIGVPLGQSFSSNMRNLLASVLHAREAGVTQAEITSIWGLDPRSTGFYMKELEKKGSITRTMVTYRTVRTNRCFHVRFTANDQSHANIEDDLIPSNVNQDGVPHSKDFLLEQITKLLQGAPDHIMRSLDLLAAMGFDITRRRTRSWFHRCIDPFVTQGILLKKSFSHNGQINRCLQLVTNEEQSSEASNKYKDDDDGVDQGDRSFNDLQPFVMRAKTREDDPRGYQFGLTSEYQFRTLIVEAGDKGMIQKDLCAQLRCDYIRIPSKCLDRVVKISGDEQIKYGLERAIEFEGRNRRYRYFDLPSYIKNQDGREITIPNISVFDVSAYPLQDVNPTSSVKKIRRGGPGRGKKKRPASVAVSSDEAEPTRTESPAAPVVAESSAQASSSAPAPPSSNVPLASIFTRQPRKTPPVAPNAPSPGPSSAHPTRSGRPPKKKLRQGECSDEPMEELVEEPAKAPPKRRGRQPKKQQLQVAPATEPTEENTVSPVDKSTDQSTNTPLDEPIQPPSSSRALGSKRMLASTSPVKGAPPTGETPTKRRREQRATTKVARASIMSYFQRCARLEEEDSPPGEDNQAQPEQSHADLQKPAPGDEDDKAANAMEHDLVPDPALDNHRSPSPPPLAKPPTDVTSKDKAPATSHTPLTGPSSPASAPASPTLTPKREWVDASDAILSGPASPDPAASPVRIAAIDEGRMPASANLHRVLQQKQGIVINHGRKNRKSVNDYLLKRKAIILEIVQEKRVVEHGLVLRTHFNEKWTAAHGDKGKGHSIDNRTLLRSARELQNEGKLHIAEGTVVNLNGTSSERKLIIHKDLDPNGSEVKNYFNYLNERKVLTPHSMKMSVFERVQGNIESLPERIDRMEKELETARTSKHQLEVRRLETELDRIRSNFAKTVPLPAKRHADWVMAALQCGYILARLIRAKMFHEYLVDLLASADPVADQSDVDKEKRSLSIAYIIRHMPLHLMCKLIGVLTPNDEIVLFLRDETNANMTADQLPLHIRSLLFNDKNKFRVRLRTLLDCLTFLGILEPKYITLSSDMKPGNSSGIKHPSHLAAHYELNTSTCIRNYRHEAHPILREHDIVTPSELMIYWSDLEYVCTATDQNSNRSTMRLYTDGNEDESWIKSLYTTKNWCTNYNYTNDQYRQLTKHVDYENYTTPLNSSAWIGEIADELKITPAVVRHFYRKVELVMQRQGHKDSVTHVKLHQTKAYKALTMGQRKARTPRKAKIKTTALYNKSRPLAQEGLKMTKEYARQLFVGDNNTGRLNPSWVSTQARLAQDQRQQGQWQTPDVSYAAPFLDGDADVPHFGEGEASRLKIPRAPRATWTSEEDDLLKLAYVIAVHRCTFGSRFQIYPIEEVLVKFNNAQIRRRIGWLRSRPADAEDLMYIRNRWNCYYREGLKAAVLMEWKHVNDKEVDLLPYIQYYLERSKSDTHDHKPATPLPANVNEVDKYYDILEPEPVMMNGGYFFEDAYHAKTAVSSTRRIEVLYNHTFYMRCDQPSSYDHPLTKPDSVDINADRRMMALIKDFAKIILTTPFDEYDAHFALGVISSFDKDDLKAALQQMRRNGYLIVSRTVKTHERRLPSTRFILSERYIRALMKQLPENLMFQARAYDKFLMESMSVVLDPVELSSGMVMSMLDLLSDEKLSVTMATGQDDKIKEIFERPHHGARNLVESSTNYDIDLTIGPCRPIPDVPMGMTILPSKLPLSDEYEAMVAHFLADPTVPDDLKEIASAIMTYLETVQEQGATILQLHEALSIKVLSTDDNFKTALDLLVRQRTPALAMLVGFESIRVVLTKYAGAWVVQTSDIVMPPIDIMLALAKQTEEESQDDADAAPVAADDDQPQKDEVDEGLTERDLVLDPMEKNLGRSVEIAKKRQPVLMPRLWQDINGNRTENIWRGCLELIMETMIQRPGISFGNLCRLYTNAMSPLEIHDLLQHLLDQGAVRQATLQTTMSTGLFGQASQTLRTTSSSNVSIGNQTCFWLTHGFYHSQ
ncbi:hypothetical protein DM01DRAFT_1405937 [Hesseltinella vesiculosa]|uniref:Uncharacterized protein n=1 Tax=Hesseltinella vesiculosa TaxID=101127 RepID=A0A1X2GP98_9FUNG|nr:hypothetical protein DM01DRAFT_1405937 [Hesseltinella vesiculosa]